MARLPLILILMTLVLSIIVLTIDFKTEQGLLNLIGGPAADENNGNLEAQIHQTNKKEIEKSVALDKKTEAKQADHNLAPGKLPADKEVSANPVKVPFIICIDPGHQAQGNSEQEPIGPGAAETKDKVTYGTTGASTNKPEYVLNLEAAIILKELLENEGVQVIMTRTSHDVDISNRERAEIANQHQSNLFVRIHADGSEDPNVKGFSVLVPAKANPYTANLFEDSYAAAQSIVNKVSAQNYPLLGDGLFLRDNLSGFNWSQVPVILLELGFMTNPEEDRLLSDEDYLTNLLKEVADGILDYAHTQH